MGPTVGVGSTRPGRRAATVARWVAGLARHDDATVDIVDLADHPLPHLDEPVPPMMGKYFNPHTRDWSATIAGYDAYIFVTPEYNHSTSGVLKNALDFLFAEWNDKAAGFVSYGVDGGTRAVEHLRLVAGELRLADVRSQVPLVLSRDFAGDEVRPSGNQPDKLRAMVDELVAWGGALRALRTGTGPAVAARGR
ncbi:NADPH-dependent FMN reductase [Plantactinospora sp. GCM10030261]|uniref:NADPH-dependent FMN reductase n=1 Tax=Plantactinospora sp. GCM10030261 TaxID=3273420 RepID=UPI003610F2B6